MLQCSYNVKEFREFDYINLWEIIDFKFMRMSIVADNVGGS